MHEHLSTLPFLGDTTSNQALIYSPAFSSPNITDPTYPNYALPAANLSFPTAPSSSPNFTLIFANSSQSISSLPQTACALRSMRRSGTVLEEQLWLRDTDGWRTEWLLGGLSPSTNYTVYTIQDDTKISGPIYIATKSASFSCPLVHSLPYCPSVSFAAPLSAPAFPKNAHDSTTLPSSLTDPLLSYVTNFTTSLLTFACGRDFYSPLQSCADCQRGYRKWLCTISFPRCAEFPSNVTTSTTDDGAQRVFPALLPQASGTPPRNPSLGNLTTSFAQLLPCIETCTATDRACPNFLGFKCPVVAFNANESYGVGYIDNGRPGIEGGGLTGVAQDRWGNVYCNGS
ncbi:hypothetical protein EW146_g4535 [Bondarzewia mesenterica]|uniref:FZ domain-containing protein n=1 Tax=Bondarzewia mesenterica TaxID=1095465 RepID=A0A4S4LVC8_9AGAM|nr:hypothetical protein EW146_g4535 [Bondarzewia mesenterica]